MRGLLAFALAACWVGGVQAQAGLGSHSGPFATVDVAGSPFVVGVEGKAFGATVGYHFARSGEVSLHLERAPAQQDPLFDTAGKTLVGAGASLAYGPARTPVRFALVAGVAVEDQSGLAVFRGGGSEFRGGRRVYQLDATASAVKYFPLASGAVQLSAGVGPFVEVRHILPGTTTFNAGSPDEVVSDNGPRYGVAARHPAVGSRQHPGGWRCPFGHRAVGTARPAELALGRRGVPSRHRGRGPLARSGGPVRAPLGSPGPMQRVAVRRGRPRLGRHPPPVSPLRLGDQRTAG